MLIDTGAAKNYVKPLTELKTITPVAKSFSVNSIHGSTEIKRKCLMNIFQHTSPFFLLDTLSSFDAIIGFDLLTQAGVKLNLAKNTLEYQSTSEKLQYYQCADVNFTDVNDIVVPPSVKKEFRDMILRNKRAFSNRDEALPFNTAVIATIRTVDNEPVYSRYPSLMGDSDFINKDVKQLLDDGIIRPSRSPYNSPTWVVDKKGTDSYGNPKKRLVIDFRKLNEKTIPDRYPMPRIPMILANLGKAKYFTTLDLKSGYHQIYLAEHDREKTSFSVSSGKYEFCRLPFGLRNASSIFQRAIDDILREHIGKICFVYVDDVIIFSKNETEHLQHINIVLKCLIDANMRVGPEKTRFFKESIEFLGFIVTKDGATSDPKKVKAIQEFPEPKNVYSVRSFLGLANYYRVFIKDFAAIARPISDILKGENGSVSRHVSKKIPVEFNEVQRDAFHRLRSILASEDVMLMYPNFQKPFDLTTDASASGIGAVLSQGNRPITMISRALKQAEQNYATNERELLAIVWALGRLQNFLYGSREINIFTDHQPLTFAVSDKNTNSKIKRWKSYIDQHNAKMFYKPGKENLVADALSRQNINALEDGPRSDAATVHSELSLTYTVETTDKPLNCFRNQIVLEESRFPLKRNLLLFRSKTRHLISYTDKSSILKTLKEVVNSGVVNAIHCDLPTLASFQHDLILYFPATQFWHCKNLVQDITDKNEQLEIITAEHNRAHRAAQENIKQVLRDYYFPNMASLAKEVVANSRVCTKAKYDRHPKKQELGETPIPSYTGEMLHIDIFSTDKKQFLTSIDKFSKFAVVQPILSRTIIDVTSPLLQIVNLFPATKTIYCDNEAAFNSETITSMLRNVYGICIVNAAPLHSTSNGQVERFHSTLTEIARCLKLDKKISDTTELILKATIEYNKVLHSVTLEKPIEVVHAAASDRRGNVKNRLIKAQQDNIKRCNASRQNRVFEVGEKVFQKNNKRLGNKLTPLCSEQKVEADLGTSVLIKGRVVHKDNLK
uniref:RNA-directed DNA polymerase n=1 Tax=Drosophila virilis TaxID=7244 RepID=Q24749_DROVI|nr:reverse transcriptase endonuclease [Drosophila virilis]